MFNGNALIGNDMRQADEPWECVLTSREASSHSSSSHDRRISSAPTCIDNTSNRISINLQTKNSKCLAVRIIKTLLG